MFVTHYFTNSKWRKKKRICMLSLLCWILKKRQLHNSYCNCSWRTKAIQMFGMWFKFSKERRINKTHHVLSSRFYKLDIIENRFIFNQLNSKTSTGTPPLTRFFGPGKNRVKGKPRYRRSILVLKPQNGEFDNPKSTFSKFLLV